ncbi:hypothetical protein BU16DRAFT_565942 [Lophium mytilinum]|uniref:Uncharacterized protein n=1 Tax=Lophium mytilinum TaxID=390894 RepID=A0A6A6QG67_9PEZI|nr:hypothetical protein BU16DRAFT_565942 [Lophium mytilinum]
MHQHHSHNHFHHARRDAAVASADLLPRGPAPADPVMEIPSRALHSITRALLPRDKCTGSANECEKPTPDYLVPVVCAVIIPVFLAIVVLLFLHRRHQRKLKEEDRNDPHKSLDFGLETTGMPSQKGKGIPEMTITDTEKTLRGDKGLSMDLGVGSPYILPAGLNNSRESVNSMARSMDDPHDPYRPVTFIKDSASMRTGSSTRAPRDNSSMYTGSSGGTDRMNGSLLKNAQRMSQSVPPRGDSKVGSPLSEKPPQIQFPAATAQPAGPPSNPQDRSPPRAPASNGGLAPNPADGGRDSYFDNNANAMRASNNYLGSFIHSRDGSTVEAPGQAQSPPEPTLPHIHAPRPISPPAKLLPEHPRPPPRIQSQEAVVISNANNMNRISDTSDYGDGFKVTPPSREQSYDGGNASRRSVDAPMPVQHEESYNNNNNAFALGVDDLGYDPRRLSMSLRPLPPDDPADNPETRANRIRSFYKEYFDDSKPDPVGYYEDYNPEYLADGTIFDPETGNFVMAQAPYAQPIGRRAMTPPPRAPPRFQGQTGRGRASSGSTGHFMPPPRGNSSMSGRVAAPRRPLPPPTPLTSLPTPGKLKEDSAIFNPLDFAPPVSYRDRQAGRRPDSPLGAPRPYSPAVRAHTPLVGAFDDLPAMPSPHALRKSSTFTALDFAPPPKFRDNGSGSDAGSIRSTRSAMSQVQLNSIRAGAYRVSRMPKEVVGTRDDLMESLRPQMNLGRPA